MLAVRAEPPRRLRRVGYNSARRFVGLPRRAVMARLCNVRGGLMVRGTSLLYW